MSREFDRPRRHLEYGLHLGHGGTIGTDQDLRLQDHLSGFLRDLRNRPIIDNPHAKGIVVRVSFDHVIMTIHSDFVRWRATPTFVVAVYQSNDICFLRKTIDLRVRPPCPGERALLRHRRGGQTRDPQKNKYPRIFMVAPPAFELTSGHRILSEQACMRPVGFNGRPTLNSA